MVVMVLSQFCTLTVFKAMSMTKPSAPACGISIQSPTRSMSLSPSCTPATKERMVSLNTSISTAEAAPSPESSSSGERLASVAASTVVRRLALLSHVFTVLRKDWGLSWLANPVQLVRRPGVDDARERRLFERIRLRGVSQDVCPREELAWIVQATRSRELPTILMLAVETGMRRSEICGMRREHVDLLHGVVHLPDTKNGTSRDVPLTPWAKEGLRRFLVGRALRGAVFGMRAGSVTRAFIRARRRARQRYEETCRRHGRQAHPAYFHDLRLHDLRHEAMSRLADVFEMHKLAKVSGHRDTRLLLRYYHPRGWELARSLARSALGRRQLEAIRRGRAAGHPPGWPAAA